MGYEQPAGREPAPHCLNPCMQGRLLGLEHNSNRSVEKEERKKERSWETNCIVPDV